MEWKKDRDQWLICKTAPKELGVNLHRPRQAQEWTYIGLDRHRGGHT